MNNIFSKKGFLLIEALIYLILSSLFFLLLFQFVVRTYSNHKNLRHKNSHESELSNLANILTRDIQSASKDIISWKKISNEELIFKVNNIDIGYICNGQKIYRIEGQYNKASGNWTNKIQSLSCRHIKKFSTSINTQEYTKKYNNTFKEIKIVSFFIETIFNNKTFKITKCVCPRNGAI